MHESVFFFPFIPCNSHDRNHVKFDVINLNSMTSWFADLDNPNGTYMGHKLFFGLPT